MKTFFAVILLVFLASCGEDVAVQPEVQPVVEVENVVVQETTEDISSAIAELPEEEVLEESESTASEEVMTLSTSYTNPKNAEIEMEVNYLLNDDDTISEITVSSESHPTDRHVVALNEKIQESIGKTLDEAGEVSISGSTLATAAFQQMLKN